MHGRWLTLCILLLGCHQPPKTPASSPSATAAPHSHALPTARSSFALQHAVIPLHNMDARDAAEALRRIVPDAWGVHRIRADVAHNSLHLDAPPEAIARIRTLLAPGPEQPTETIVVVYLENATASQLQPTVQAAAPQGVVAVADEPTNSIVLAGPLGWDPEPLRAVIRNRDR